MPSSEGALTNGALKIPGVLLAPAVTMALRKRGVDTLGKLRLATDKLLNSAVDDVIAGGVVPPSEQWKAVEDAAALFKRFGELLYPVARKLWRAQILRIDIGVSGEVRVERIAAARARLRGADPEMAATAAAVGASAASADASGVLFPAAPTAAVEAADGAQQRPGGGGGGGGGAGGRSHGKKSA